MTIYKAVQNTANRENRLAVFLAGSIENGAAENWQQDLSEFFDKLGLDVYNPRREAWNSSWEQSVNNPQFVEQVNWELDHILKADIVLFYFQPGTMSPISLLELGLVNNLNKQVIVICPTGFWRKGNVDIVCQRYNFVQYNSLKDLKENYVFKL